MIIKSVALAVFVAAPAHEALPGVRRSGGAYTAGSMTTGSGSTATTTLTYEKRNVKCSSRTLSSTSHCPTYYPRGTCSDQGFCHGIAATPAEKPTYAIWTGVGCPESWVAGQGGDVAELNGVFYKCSEAQFINQWCGQSLSKPADSLYWASAWSRQDLGSCDGKSAVASKHDGNRGPYISYLTLF